MRVHFIAIGGAVMHNLALALHQKGYKVTGSDDEIFEPSRSRLANAGLLPETEGWDRRWGNWDGPYEGDGAIRTVADGILTMDSLFDAGVYDYARLDRPGHVDPGPGETFVMEWRVLVDETIGEPYYDAGARVGSDDAWQLGFGVYPDALLSTFEDLTIPIAAGVFHEYRAVSSDMRSYELFVDGELALTGEFWEGLTESRFGWGDRVQGVASRAHWDYFRVGVIPEPSSCLLFFVLGAMRMRNYETEPK